MLSLLNAMPITTSSLSTCSGMLPTGASRIAWLACVIVALNGVCGSRSSSHLMRSTFEERAAMGGSP